MISRSLTILTRGRVAKNAVTYITSGYIFLIEEFPPSTNYGYNGGVDFGGRKPKEEQNKKRKKIVRVTVYISNNRYVEEKEVDEDLKISAGDVSIELNEITKRPIIRIKGIK